MKIVAAIIAGGTARRVGGANKSELYIKGKTILEMQLEVLTKIFSEIITISNIKPLHPQITNFSDIYPNQGPMAGIHSALVNSQADYVLAVSSDMPFIQKVFVDKLISSISNEFDAIVPFFNNLPEPLLAVYNKSCLPVIEKSLIDKQNAIHKILNLLSLKQISVQPDEEINFFNINTPADYAKAIAISEKLIGRL